MEVVFLSEQSLNHSCKVLSERDKAAQATVCSKDASLAGKQLKHLFLMLQEAGSRPLIFSQWTMVLDILEWLLQCLKLPFVRLDGTTAVADRLTIVDMYGSQSSIAC